MKIFNLLHQVTLFWQVEMSSLPVLPKQRELMNKLGPLHARLSSDKIAAKKHPVYKCNKWQVISYPFSHCFMFLALLIIY
ncbi:hypothetical protein HanOQP8_Chr01g0018771 [Helianthus annuus]|nr:hypothetical protein HanOQP8_Chr01g0018771 [Helianthus annuus]